jgi:hypothetical protein
MIKNRANNSMINNATAITLKWLSSNIGFMIGEAVPTTKPTTAMNTGR